MDEKKISGNFIDKCFNNSFYDESCIMGIVILIISLVPLFFNIYAFAKMTMFYKKLNFENTIILISAIEIFILEFALTTSFDFFLQFFFFMQMITISWLIKKFSNLIKDMNSLFKNNIFFISINVINLIIFILYIIFMITSEKDIYVINLIYKLFYFISTCLLSYICIFMNRLITKHKLEYLENYNNLFDLDALNIDNNEQPDLGKIINDESKKDNDKSHSREEKDINSTKEAQSEGKNKQKGEVFYHIKKKQNRCLYIINLLCSSLQLIFSIIRFFVIHEDFLEDIYKIVPLTLLSEILFYFYIIICLINISVIFYCFYYYIRRQYSRNTKVFKKKPSRKILDDAFIEEQKKKEDSIEANEGVLATKSTLRKISSDDDFKFFDKM